MPGDRVGGCGDGQARSSGATGGARRARRPQARTRAASACELEEETMPPGGICSPGRAISSPVARIGMRGRRNARAPRGD